MIIIQVTDKIFLVFFSPKEILLDTNTFSISTSFKSQDFYFSKIYFFQFQYNQTLKFLNPFLYEVTNVYVLQCSAFFSQTDILH